MENTLSEMLESLCSPKKLDRDRAIPELQQYMQHADTNAIHTLGDTLINLSANDTWESRNCAMMSAKYLLLHMTTGDKYCDEFAYNVRVIALNLLNDCEVRVRLAASELLGTLCEKYGPVMYSESKDVVLNLIQSNLERELSDNGSCASLDAEQEKLMEKFASSSDTVADAKQIFHDTAGWKSLETSLKALQCMIDGCGTKFEPWITQELLDLVFQTLSHTNRFVRETGYGVINSFINSSIENIENEAGSSNVAPKFRKNSAILAFGEQFSHFLGIGLTDNWSQVRFAAAVASRKFVLSMDDETRALYYPELLPKLCLNRYYLADGVRLYSQETWGLVVGTEGRELVRQYIDEVVKYYLSQTVSDNHAVREATCTCISELAVKINRDAVKPHVPQLLAALILCFQDDSWPVRDAACVACGNFTLSFPDESRDSMEALYPMFFSNLEDTIPTVRQGAAVALANVLNAYGEEALSIITNKMKDGLEKISTQTEESEKYAGVDKGPAPFGVVKRLRDNDMDLHSNQTMYSCGSLAPKMGRCGGCMSGLERTFRKPPQPWELADGCIYLLSELSSHPLVAPDIIPMLELTAKVTTYRHYTHHLNLLETVCKQLPIIAKGVGKKDFKSVLHLFLEPIFYSLNCENALTSNAASQCLNQLSNFVGSNIFRSRVEEFNPNYVRLLDANLQS